MPKKLLFTDDDLEFLFRFTERVRQKDQSLGFDASTLNRIEMVFPREVFQGTYSRVTELANDNLLNVLDAEQRKKISKARYAFQRKRNSKQVKLDASVSASLELKRIIEILKDDLGADGSMDKSLITQKRVLEATLITVRELTRSFTLPVEYQGFEKYVKQQIMTNLKQVEK
ncbi:hypothetical protein ACI7YQ_11290 [Alteromonas marina]|nr:hypothetical protein BM527_11110 [Alteromonas sp. Mex14]